MKARYASLEDMADDLGFLVRDGRIVADGPGNYCDVVSLGLAEPRRPFNIYDRSYTHPNPYAEAEAVRRERYQRACRAQGDADYEMDLYNLTFAMFEWLMLWWYGIPPVEPVPYGALVSSRRHQLETCGGEMLSADLMRTERWRVI